MSNISEGVDSGGTNLTLAASNVVTSMPTALPFDTVTEPGCQWILYADINNSGVRLWDVIILIPNCIFLLFLLVYSRSAITKLQASSSPIFTVFFGLVVAVTCISVLRCVVSMTVNASSDAGGKVDKILWLLLRFFLLATEMSVVIFGLAFGHLDSHTSIRRVLVVTFSFALIYSIIQGALEFEYDHPDFKKPGNSTDVSYDIFAHGGMIFLFTSSFLYFAIYSVILVLPCTSLRERYQLPTKKLFYYYCAFLAALNLTQAVAALILYLGEINGLCVLDATTYIYFSFFNPLVYCVFLWKFFWWMENIPVAERAIKIWPSVKKFLQEIKPLATKSFLALKELSRDHLLEVRAECFISVAKDVQPFLRKFQGSSPLIPYLASALERCLKALLERIVKPVKLKQATSYLKLISLDVEDPENLLPHSKIDVGFVADRMLKSDKFSAKDVLGIRIDAQKFIKAMVKKLQEKSPLQFKLVRNLEWLLPHVIYAKQGKERLKATLSCMVHAKQVGDHDCDGILQEFTELQDMATCCWRSEFIGYSESDRLDTFYHNLMQHSKLQQLWRVMKMCLILSHGQATVESGFSCNKEIMDVNMKTLTLSARRLICDHLKDIGGMDNLEVTTEMVAACSSARKRSKDTGVQFSYKHQDLLDDDQVSLPYSGTVTKQEDQAPIFSYDSTHFDVYFSQSNASVTRADVEPTMSINSDIPPPT